MTLLELLVNNLEGWPLNVTESSNYPKSNIYAWIDTGRGVARMEAVTRPSVTPPEHVTREQYEVALAASKKLVWNEDELPPVGIKCLTIGAHGDDSWYECTILAHTEFSGKPVAVFQYGDTISHSSAKWFKPLATEAERKREEAGVAIYHAINWNAEGELASPSRMEDYRKAYDAIAAGEIPGVKLI